MAAGLLFASGPGGQAAEGITNLFIFQRPTGGLVNIRYDLLRTNAVPLTVTVEVCTNGGTNYSLVATNFTGDIGLVSPGTNKLIVWNLASDWPNQHCTDAWFRVTAHDVPTNMALIPAGAFEMGDPFNDWPGRRWEVPVHTVYVSAIYMDRYEVTKALWNEVYYWAVLRGYSFDNPGLGKGMNHPVQTINWYDAAKWCNARSEMEGRVPAYYTDASLTTVYRSGQIVLKNDWVKWDEGYRLPTEAEWEKAARGGTGGHRFPWTDVETITHSQANYWSKDNWGGDPIPYDVSSTREYHPDYDIGEWPWTSPVGSFAPNGYGLYDMAGNVYEFCWDSFQDYYGSSPVMNPRGSDEASYYKVAREGGYDGLGRECRVAARGLSGPGFQGDDVGLRSTLPAVVSVVYRPQIGPLTLDSVPIVFSVQPTNQAVLLASNATFTATAAGTEPLHYQWYHNGRALPNVTNDLLSVLNAQPGDVGNYVCVVTNAFNAATSAVATLTVHFPPAIQWQFSFGGGAAEAMPIARATSDGGWLLAGTSASGASGNKTSGSFGGTDYWLLRLNASGTKLWETNYGGTLDDTLTALQPCPDGGWLAGGSSVSGASGNKTSAGFGGTDYWLARLDASGARLWETNYGGSLDDTLTVLQPAGDGGWLVGGSSASGPSGNKTSASFGGMDYWLIKLDANGAKLWETNCGGTLDDALTTLHPTGDGSWLAGGSSASAASGNKTCGGSGGTDYWVLKLDAGGARLWETNYGGTLDDWLVALQATGDGGWLLAGTSASEVSGNKTSSTFGGTDYWLLKLDATGARLWETNYGGTLDDTLTALQPGPDGGWLLGGHSASAVSGSKTSGNCGGDDYWLVRVDANGARLWERSLGGVGNDSLSSVQSAASGGYLAAGYSSSGVSSDKTSASFGASDFWLIKLGDGPFLAGQPQNQTVAAGKAATFSVSVTGTEPMLFRWFKEGTALPQATNAQLSILNAQLSDTADYFCVVSNNFGTVTSAVATLRVVLPRTTWWSNLGAGTITTDPPQAVYGFGDTVTLTATAGRYYAFSHWTTNTASPQQVFSLNSQLTFTLNSALTHYAAIFTNTVPLEQQVVKQWEKVYGGTSIDRLMALQPTTDGGFILGGSSDSAAGGNKGIGGFGDLDYWVIKVTATGVKQWERVLGGNSTDELRALLQTADGGYLLAGNSQSTPSGNKTSDGYGGGDYWVVKLDADGNKLWEASFGGTGAEVLSAVRQTPDGGYLLVGSSASDANGSKTTANLLGTPGSGVDDGWIVKLDANGIKQWEQAFGSGFYDHLSSVSLTDDGGYILVGDLVPDDSYDFWLLKLDATGAKQWERTYGGDGYDVRAVVEQTRDGGYIVGGSSNSGATGDKTTPGSGDYDYWVLKLDANGNKEWERTYGGAGSDELYVVHQTADGGYVLGGDSTSGTSGNKTSAGYGLKDFWVLKLDGLGNKQWERVCGSSEDDYLNTLELTADESLAFGGSSGASANGNRTVPGFGSRDYWLVRVAFREVPVGLPLITVNGTFEPSGNYFFGNSAQVLITSTFTNAFITFTRDGSNPDFRTNGLAEQYQAGGFTVTTGLVLRAFAWNPATTAAVEADAVHLGVSPTFPLNTSTPGGGWVTNSPPTGPYFSNTVVTVTAGASNDWTFLNWARDLGGTNNPSSIVMDSPKTIQALFGSPLNLVASPANGGSVLVKPGLSLPPYGSTNRLTAIPTDGNFFYGWAGAAVGSGTPFDFILTNANPTLYAIFLALMADEYALTILEQGSGTVARSPLANKYASGTTVTLTASPQAGHVFSGWSGDLVGTFSPTQLVMNASLVITATFVPNNPPTIALLVPTDGQEFIIGTPITLSATASDLETSVQRVEFLTNGVLLAAVTNAPYLFTWTNAPVGSHGLAARSLDTLGTPSTNATATITVRAIAPGIVQQPAAVAVLAGSNVVFSVGVTNTATPPISYQWYKSVLSNQWSAVSRATNFQFLMLNAQLSDAGSYQVVVTNDGGSVTSAVAQLRVITLDNVRTDFGGVDGPVYALAQTNGVLYVGGDFDYAAPVAGGGAVMDLTNGVPWAAGARVNGDVKAVVGDRQGGWFLGGFFTAVGGQPRSRLAHVLEDGSVDPNWAPQASAAVNALALSDDGTTLYVGGAFTDLSGSTRNGIAALNATSGTVRAWNPNAVNGSVDALAVAGNAVYAGGQFTAIGGQPRTHLARLLANVNESNADLGWAANANAGGSVNAIAVSGDRVYVGGLFQSLRGVARDRLAALSPTDGTVDLNWDPRPNDAVRALAVANGTVYVGGDFTAVTNVTRSAVAAVDAVTGAVRVWNPNADSRVWALAVNGDTVYLGGDFAVVGGQARNKAAAVHATTATVLDWNPNAQGKVRTLAVQGERGYAGGEFRLIGRVARHNLAAFDLLTGAVTPWNPNASDVVKALVVAGETVYVGGSFSNVGGLTRSNLAAVNTAGSGTAMEWNPNADGAVNALVVAGSTVYAGGSFNSIGGGARSRLGAVSVSTGSATAWNANVVGTTVHALALGGPTLYVGGSFAQVGAYTRSGLAAVSVTNEVNNVLAGWNPAPNGVVHALAVSGDTVYAGGLFTQIGGQPRGYIAALEGNGSASSWAPNADGFVAALRVADQTVYAGGQFHNIGRQGRSNLALLDDVSGDALGFNAGADDLVRALSVSAGTVYVGGDFGTLGGRMMAHLGMMGPEGAPVFVGQVLSLTANAASTLTLSAPVYGQGPLYYQWRLAGTNLAGATGLTLVVANVQGSQGGTYSVVVSNQLGVITNTVAQVTVATAPMPPVLPDSLVVSPGTNLTLVATATGSEPLTYRWRLNGMDLTNNATYSGVNTDRLTITNMQATNSGSYLVTVANPYGAADSGVIRVVATTNTLVFSDTYATRTPITTLAGQAAGHNVNASLEIWEVDHPHAGKPGGHSVWVGWVMPANGVATVSLAGSGLDTLLGIYTNAAGNSGIDTLQRVASDDDAGGFGTSKVSFNAIAGVEYALAVDGFGGATNQVMLNWQLEQVDEDVPRIIAEPESQTATNTTNTVTFTVSAENRSGNATNLTYQWYYHADPIPGATHATLTLPAAEGDKIGSYRVEISIGGRKVRTVPAVLELGPSRLHHTADKLEETVQAGLTANGVSRGAWPKGGKVGARNLGFGLAVSPGVLGTQILGNIGSTRELFEPTHGGVAGGASRWFALTPASSGKMIVDTIGSEINPVLAVYIGDTLLNLTKITSDNNSAPDGTNALASFRVVAQETYLIAVDSEDGSTGQIKLNWRMGEAPLIGQHPASVVVHRLGGTSFSVVASGVPVPQYQWRHDGVDMPNATNAVLTVTNVGLADAGSYSVVVSNVVDGAVSGAAQLTVLDVNSWFEPPTLLSGTGLRLQGYSPLGKRVIIQATTNLSEIPITWLPIHTNDGSLGLFDYLDLTATNHPHRFYRSIREP